MTLVQLRHYNGQSLSVELHRQCKAHLRLSIIDAQNGVTEIKLPDFQLNGGVTND